jgi:hypothetical protein
MGRLRKYVVGTGGGQNLVVAQQASGVGARRFAIGEAVLACFSPEDAVVLRDLP